MPSDPIKWEGRALELASKATPGRWKAVSDYPNYAVWSVETQKDIVQSPSRVNIKNPFGEWTTERNAEHIAHSNPDAITLVAIAIYLFRQVMETDAVINENEDLHDACVSALRAIDKFSK